VISSGVRSTDGSTFCGVPLSTCLIESDNRRVAFENAFLIDVVDHKLMRDFSMSSHITLPYAIEILSSSCFSECKPLTSISFNIKFTIERY
jgi:hypothetical protein